MSSTSQTLSPGPLTNAQICISLRVVSVEAMKSVKDLITTGMTNFDQSGFADGLLEMFRECLIWMRPLHGAGKTSSKVLAKAITLLTAVRFTILSPEPLQQQDSYENSAFDPYAEFLPMEYQVAKLPLAQVERKNVEMARVIAWHEESKAIFLQNDWYRGYLWPALVLLINCKHFLASRAA